MYIHKQENNANIFMFNQPFSVSSWAITAGGIQNNIKMVVNRSVSPEENMGDNIYQWRKFIKKIQREVQDDKAIILLTSVPAIACQFFITRSIRDDLTVATYVTAGLSNRFAPGDEVWLDNIHKKTGTLNIVCIVNQYLTHSARLEALHSITLAKAFAIMKSGLTSPNNKNEVAISTSTDCIALCSPLNHKKRHTSGSVQQELGHLIMISVTEAVKLGINCWKVQK